MTLEQFKKEILGEKVSNYTEEEIQNLFKIAVGFANSLIHNFQKEKNSPDKKLIVP